MLTLALVLIGGALAQAPSLPAMSPAGTTAALPSAQQHWIARAVPLMRWPDGVGTVAMLEVGTQVNIVDRQDDMVRVRRDMDFGWVPVDAVVDAQPGDAPAQP